MAIKFGKVVTLGQGFLVERAQSVGTGNLNIPTERIKETGNELSVSTERDTPQLSFEIESLDATIDTEAMLCNIDATTMSDGDSLNFGQSTAIDVVAVMKAAGSSKTSSGGVIWPYLTLSAATYRFGVGTQGATQTFTVDGDAQYSSSATPYREEFAGTGTDDPYAFAHTAVKTVELGDDLYAVSVVVYKADGTCERLFNDSDYTSTNSGVVITDGTKAPVGSTVAICYFSATTATFPQTIHSTPTVKPGKVKGRFINFYVAVGEVRQFNGTTTNADATLTAAGGAFTSADVGARVSGTNIPAGTTIESVTDGTHVEMSQNATGATGVVTLRPPLERWDGVQQVEINWRVTLDYDDELGNAHHVSSDYDIPDLTGSVTIRPSDTARLYAKIERVTGTAAGEVANLLSETILETQVRLQNPRTGDIVKTLEITDTRITPPGIQARVDQKVEPQFQLASGSGLLTIYKGAPA